MQESKTEAEVFFEDTKPFMESLTEQVNPQFCLNMAWNYPTLSKLINAKDLNMEIADVKSKGKPAIVIGSGPSLDECMPYLNKARETHGAPIFCTASQVWALYFQGVTPDYVTQHDPWPRLCPLCDPMEPRHVIFTDEGDITCPNGHILEGEDRLSVIRRTNIHRWAPDIDSRVLAHPGVHGENLNWDTFKRNGEMYFNNFNPNIGPVDTRSIIRGQIFGRAADRFRHLPPPAWKLEDSWRAMLDKMINAPGYFEPQDIPMWLGVILYGQGNPRIKNPIRVAATYAPSTTFQNAILAFMKGYNPIYFVGYDMCHWKHRPYHHTYKYDGSDMTFEAKPDDITGKGLNGFGVDYVKIGEKYALAGYFSKEFGGHYALPGLEFVEVIADGLCGNLEFYPKVGIDRFAKGETKNIPQERTASKIRAIVRERKIGAGWDT